MALRSYQYTVQVLITPSGGTEIPQSVSDALALSQTAVHEPLGEIVSTDLSLGQVADGLVVPGGQDNVAQELNLSQEVSVFGYETVIDSLNLSQAVVFQGPTTKSLSDSNFLSDNVEYRYGVRNFSVAHSLDLVQIGGRGFDISVSQTLGLSDDADRLSLDASNVLNLSDTADWGYGGSAVSDLNLSQTVVNNYETSQSVTHDNIVTQAAAWFIESRCARSQRTEFHGTGGVAPEPEKLQYKSTFLLQSKTTGDIVQLRNPETDNRYRHAFERVNRRFFDNSLDLYADPNWVTTRTQLYTIVANKREEMDALWQFLQDNLGMEVLLKDWKGVTWNVIITDPGQLYAEDREGYWTVDFAVVGEALDGEFIPVELNLDHECSRAGSIWTRSVEDTVVLSDSAGRNYDIEVTDNTSLTSTATFTVE